MLTLTEALMPMLLDEVRDDLVNHFDKRLASVRLVHVDAELGVPVVRACLLDGTSANEPVPDEIENVFSEATRMSEELRKRLTPGV